MIDPDTVLRPSSGTRGVANEEDERPQVAQGKAHFGQSDQVEAAVDWYRIGCVWRDSGLSRSSPGHMEAGRDY